jgi:hypothetical protein
MVRGLTAAGATSGLFVTGGGNFEEDVRLNLPFKFPLDASVVRGRTADAGATGGLFVPVGSGSNFDDGRGLFNVTLPSRRVRLESARKDCIHGSMVRPASGSGG